MKKILQLLVPMVVFASLCLASSSDTTFTESQRELKISSGTLYGTLTMPHKFTSGTVVLLISGSGPTDRNGNSPSMENNSLLQVAHGLANAGIASLRFDKRGIGASDNVATKEEDLRFDNLVADVTGWIDQLMSEKQFKKLVIAGHSEGSLVGMLAARDKAHQFISIAGAGEPAGEIIRKQLSPQPQQVKDIAYPILDSLNTGVTVSNTPPMLAVLFRASVQPYLISWFKYNPAAEIKKLKIPVLIIQGTTDIQVKEADAKKLAEAKPDAKLLIIPGMNHVLKIAVPDVSENLKTYNNPSLPLADGLLSGIIQFIKGQ